MVDVIKKLKTEARLLHRRAAAGEESALARIRKLHESPDLDNVALRQQVKRRHCLGVIAQDLGFQGWSHAAQVLRGDDNRDFGKLLYPRGCYAHSNIWSASYNEARQIRDETEGYLLAYRHHYLIVDPDYIRTMGLDPDDPDWQEIGFDWVKPCSLDARGRLYAKLIEASTALSVA